MFNRILIANRGEPAVRVIRSCRELGIETVVVYSEIDRATLPVRLADRAVCIGPEAAADSYLNIPRILSAAEITGSEAIHPGYGFLSESVELAETVEACGLRWVGPKSETMRRLSDRLHTRSLARQLGVPLLPGSEQEVTSAAEAHQLAAAIGYPVVLKPVRLSRQQWIVRRERDIENTLRIAQAEGKALLLDGRVFLERYLEEARCLEVSILGDSQGRVIHLFEREVSVQHRQEKIIAEAPSPAVTPELRRQLGNWARALAESAGYQSAGCVEFIVDPNGQVFFQDICFGLQPAHPVTEVLLGCDIVAEQIRIAAGEPTACCNPSAAGDCLPDGVPHVIQCWINAEDPDNDFVPTAGRVTLFRIPGGPGVRVDTHVYSGYQGRAQYDSLVAKVIVQDTDREKTIVRMERALQEMAIEGVKTTLEFQLKILRLGAFRKGKISTALIEREILGRRNGTPVIGG